MSNERDFSQYVHEFEGHWIVAQHHDSQYYAPLETETRKLANSHITVMMLTHAIGSLRWVMSRATCKYSQRYHALAKAREIYGNHDG